MNTVKEENIMTLTPKDCLYIEDLVNAMVICIKKNDCEMEKVTDKKVHQFLEKINSELKAQAEKLVCIMEESK